MRSSVRFAPAISLDTVGALLVEREAIKARLAEHQACIETLRAEHEALLKTHAACAADAERANRLGRAANRPT